MPNQALEQTRDGVLRYGESVGCELLNFFVSPKTMNNNEFSDYWAFLVEKKYSTHAALSSDERIFYAANAFRGSVPRSGLVGYFENTECDEIRDAHHALETLGLFESLRLLRDAQDIVLNGKSLPENNQCISVFDYDLPDEEVEKAMEVVGQRLREIEGELYLQDEATYDSLCRFADERGLRVPKG